MASKPCSLSASLADFRRQASRKAWEWPSWSASTGRILGGKRSSSCSRSQRQLNGPVASKPRSKAVKALCDVALPQATKRSVKLPGHTTRAVCFWNDFFETFLSFLVFKVFPLPVLSPETSFLSFTFLPATFIFTFLFLVSCGALWSESDFRFFTVFALLTLSGAFLLLSPGAFFFCLSSLCHFPPCLAFTFALAVVLATTLSTILFQELLPSLPIVCSPASHGTGAL
mmetsp:Transcript_77354/g.170883  ORF Transcript_77354/g.170883 Transcript_77354/m.170883 type:complete len:228 (-) Transcript_77354:31-714(-)